MVRKVKVSSPYELGRIRELLAYGSCCVEGNSSIPKDGSEDVSVTFCFGRGGKTTVTVRAVANWRENRYPADWGRVTKEHPRNVIWSEDEARVSLKTGELISPNSYVAHFQPCHIHNTKVGVFLEAI